jgi:predicted NUDIX family phosphoesterase
MSKEDQIIMVVERSVLFGDEKNSFHGFRNAECGIPYESLILNNYSFKRRGDMEHNPLYKQPIAYCIIANIAKKRFFVYQRGSDSKNVEARLADKWSWGLGGHIEQKDVASTGTASGSNPLYDSMLREISEETNFIDGKILDIQLLGYVNDDSDSVGKVHFGLLYLLKTDAEIVQMKGNELQTSGMVSPEWLEKICGNSSSNVETWSRIAMTPLREQYRSLGFAKHDHTRDTN